ncbi:SpoIIAA family protein [Hymenobacter psychrophilus]|uniref:SpoIIAA-like n=1 Tax=Hymenobacter psychrophilus TaxID=651662 RepID=A0A1H3LSM4_9BACT|nr:STAS/SEC14 domain-containing protein [Hymenobacter psychrophilus]SDY67320.1 hypothetical protein SAMN04488069_111113 [Hymenobacter psychrophilus]
MLCFENPAGRILLHSTFVRVVWNIGERQDACVMELMDRLLAIGRQHNLSRLLVDQGLMDSCSVEVEVWFKYDWLTRARLQFDFGAAAILSGRNILVRMATLGMLRHLLGWTGTFQIRVFASGQTQEAIEWLSQPSPRA